MELKLIKSLIRKLFTHCIAAGDQYIHEFLHRDIILPGIVTLKSLEAEKSVSISKYFVSEEDAIEKLHPSLLHFAINLCLEFRV